MQLIVLAAGRGSRFRDSGFILPKPLISLNNYPLFWWATESAINYNNFSSVHFVVLLEHVINFSVDKIINKYYPNANIHILKSITAGAAATAASIMIHLNSSEPICTLDSDLAFSFESEKTLKIFKHFEAGLCVFNSNNIAFSYAKVDRKKMLISTHEKSAITNNAIAGIYYFNSPEIFMKHYNSYVMNCNYSELFISGLFNQILKTGAEIPILQLKEHFSLGTPEELLASAGLIQSIDWFSKK